jgi:hypothetical protein
MADKSRKRRISSKQRTTTLFYLWHNLRDLKAEAEQMAEGELVLLLGMVELLVEDRISGLNLPHGAAMAAANTAHPN